jgi:hypothetical protein
MAGKILGYDTVQSHISEEDRDLRSFETLSDIATLRVIMLNVISIGTGASILWGFVLFLLISQLGHEAQ